MNESKKTGFDAFVEDLYGFAKQYVSEIVVDLASRAHELYEDKSVVYLLASLREKERAGERSGFSEFELLVENARPYKTREERVETMDLMRRELREHEIRCALYELLVERPRKEAKSDASAGAAQA